MGKTTSIAKVLRPLIILPVTVIVDIALVTGGFWLDKMSYTPPPDVASFMFPVFTIIFMIIAAIISIIALIVMIILLAVRISGYRKAKKDGMV